MDGMVLVPIGTIAMGPARIHQIAHRDAMIAAASGTIRVIKTNIAVTIIVTTITAIGTMTAIAMTTTTTIISKATTG
jgi:hypothetical protein